MIRFKVILTQDEVNTIRAALQAVAEEAALRGVPTTEPRVIQITELLKRLPRAK